MKTIYIDKEKIGKWKSKRIAKKLYKRSKKEDIVIALCKNLMKNKFINNALDQYGLKALNGRWLLKFLLCDILDYASINIKKHIEESTVALLMDKADEIIMQQIKLIAKKVKNLKLITNNKVSYSYLEDELFNKEGIAIHITNNKEKSLSNIDIILNFDFKEKRINEYKINQNAIIINLGDEIELNKSVFDGKIINSYEICFNEENYNLKIDKEKYYKNILYESYIYRKDTFENIKKQLKKDNVKILKIA